MHELSIAQALYEQALRHLPTEGGRITSLRLRIGPAQMIVEEALHWGWEAVTDGTPHAGSRLEMELPPWELSCPACQRSWSSRDHLEPCVCGSPGRPQGDAELTLLTMQVEQPQPQEAATRDAG